MEENSSIAGVERGGPNCYGANLELTLSAKIVMAYRRFSLPALKLTQRPTYGKSAYKVIQRGLFSDVNDDGASGSREVSTPAVSGVVGFCR